jgi:hypothetical protein
MHEVDEFAKTRSQLNKLREIETVNFRGIQIPLYVEPDIEKSLAEWFYAKAGNDGIIPPVSSIAYMILPCYVQAYASANIKFSERQGKLTRNLVGDGPHSMHIHSMAYWCQTRGCLASNLMRGDDDMPESIELIRRNLEETAELKRDQIFRGFGYLMLQCMNKVLNIDYDRDGLATYYDACLATMKHIMHCETVEGASWTSPSKRYETWIDACVRSECFVLTAYKRDVVSSGVIQQSKQIAPSINISITDFMRNWQQLKFRDTEMMLRHEIELYKQLIIQANGRQFDG